MCLLTLPLNYRLATTPDDRVASLAHRTVKLIMACLKMEVQECWFPSSHLDKCQEFECPYRWMPQLKMPEPGKEEVKFREIPHPATIKVWPGY